MIGTTLGHYHITNQIDIHRMRTHHRRQLHAQNQ
jgi:hypothetical protein